MLNMMLKYSIWYNKANKQKLNGNIKWLIKIIKEITIKLAYIIQIKIIKK